jgi:septal ring factor EnvC (AmiA/AmiB activator)
MTTERRQKPKNPTGKNKQTMKNTYKIILSLLLCVIALSAKSQKEVENDNITISASRYDGLRDRIRRLNDSTKFFTDSCAFLHSEIRALQKENAQLRKDIEAKGNILVEKSSLVNKKDSFITALKDRISTDSLTLSKLQSISDDISGRYANLCLFSKYDANLISRSLELCSNIQTQSVKKTFRHLPNLLNAYKNYSDQLKLILESAQNDPTRTKKASMEEYKEKYKRSIKSMEYYSRYYAKKSSGTWSIPYLDNIIKAFFNIIDKHNPLNFEYADFKCLIEML